MQKMKMAFGKWHQMLCLKYFSIPKCEKRLFSSTFATPESKTSWIPEVRWTRMGPGTLPASGAPPGASNGQPWLLFASHQSQTHPPDTGRVLGRRTSAIHAFSYSDVPKAFKNKHFSHFEVGKYFKWNIWRIFSKCDFHFSKWLKWKWHLEKCTKCFV